MFMSMQTFLEFCLFFFFIMHIIRELVEAICIIGVSKLNFSFQSFEGLLQVEWWTS